MGDRVERLKEECTQLDKRLFDLGQFIISDAFCELSEPNKLLLRRQSGLMNEYRRVLLARIEMEEHG